MQESRQQPFSLKCGVDMELTQGRRGRTISQLLQDLQAVKELKMFP